MTLPNESENPVEIQNEDETAAVTETSGDENLNQEDEGKISITPEEELAMLKKRADLMGVTYSNRIGIEALRAKINAKLDGEADPGEGKIEEAPTQPNPLNEGKPVQKETIRQRLQREQMRLVRLRITNMNPKKASIPGEIITVGNRYLGTVRKYIPFGEATENGYHVPYCLYKALKNRKFLQIREIKDRRTGTNRIETSWVREFALEELPPLTEQELKDLAIAQAAAGAID